MVLVKRTEGVPSNLISLVLLYHGRSQLLGIVKLYKLSQLNFVKQYNFSQFSFVVNRKLEIQNEADSVNYIARYYTLRDNGILCSYFQKL